MTSRAVVGGLVATGAVAWGGYAAVTWRRYGRAHQAWGRPDPLDAFIPDPEVEKDQRMRVRALAAMTFRAARELDLQRSPVVRLIFGLRSLPARLWGSSARLERVGLVEAMLGIGWGVLLDVPDEQLFVAGAVTQPWAAEVAFRPLPADEFAAFDEPGYAKIIWTLEAQACPSTSLWPGPAFASRPPTRPPGAAFGATGRCCRRESCWSITSCCACCASRRRARLRRRRNTIDCRRAVPAPRRPAGQRPGASRP